MSEMKKNFDWNSKGLEKTIKLNLIQVPKIRGDIIEIAV